MTERTVKIKGLIRDEVCMGTYGLVELELLEIENEMEALRQLAVSSQVCDCQQPTKGVETSKGIICYECEKPK